MSQAGIISTSGGGGGGSPIETVTTQDGVAVPIANNIIISADDTTDNDTDGIRTVGGGNGNPATAANEVRIELTNRITGTAQTTDNTTVTNLITPFDVGASPATYLMFVRIAVFNVTDNISASYASYRTVRATGAAALSISGVTAFNQEEGAMFNLLITNGVAGNTATLTAVGLAGKTINYTTLIEYQRAT